jgi:hypothetical protein
MLSYTTFRGDILDLSDLSAEERAHFDRCYLAYREGMDMSEYHNQFAYGAANPALQATGGWVTQAVWDSLLFRAVRDLGDRLGMSQGLLLQEDDWQSDPIEDTWVPVAEAAQQKGVTRSGLHAAIERGVLVARPRKPGGTHLVVSARSLARWEPMHVRQEVGRKGAAARS